MDLSSKRSIFVSDNGVLGQKVGTLRIKNPSRELETFKKVVYTLTGPTVAQCENPPCDQDPFTYDCRIIDEVLKVFIINKITSFIFIAFEIQCSCTNVEQFSRYRYTTGSGSNPYFSFFT